MATYNTLQTSDDFVNWRANNIPCGISDSSDQYSVPGLGPSSFILPVGDMNIISPNATIPKGAIFRLSTFGTNATCSSITHFCNITVDQANGTCESAPPEFTWSSNLTYLKSIGANAISYPIIDDSSDRVESWYRGKQDYIHLLDYPLNTTGPGGYTIFMQLWWSEQDSLSDLWPSLNQDVITIVVVNCNFTYYNLTVQYQDRVGYNITEKVIADRFLSDGFSGLMRANAPSKILMKNLGPVFLSGPGTSTDGELMEAVSEGMSQLALASANIFANTTGPALWQQQIHTRILGRYPIIPVVLLVSVLFLNSLFALVICVATSFSRTDSIRVPGKIGSKSVPLLDLARIRLVSPAALVADRFPLKDPVNLRRVEIQAKQDTLDMFCEDAVERRVRIGMHEDKESGESVFGTWVEDSDEI